MKQLLKTIAIILICAAAGSQASKAEFRWGPTAGVTITNFNFKQDLVQTSNGFGPVVGVQGEMMFPGIGFGIDLGAMYAMQGATLDLGRWPLWRDQSYGKEHINLHTLQIPVNLRFKWTRMNGWEDYAAPYVFGGPVVNITLAHSSCKAFEYASSFGLQAGLGFEIFKRWQVQGSYMWGLTYATKASQLIDYSARLKGWTVRATYFF